MKVQETERVQKEEIPGELQVAMTMIKERKSPGPDNIFPEIVRATVNANPE